MRLKTHQLTRLQKLAVQVKGLIQEAEFNQDFKEATRLRNTQFHLTQIVFKFGL